MVRFHTFIYVAGLMPPTQANGYGQISNQFDEYENSRIEEDRRIKEM